MLNEILIEKKAEIETLAMPKQEEVTNYSLYKSLNNSSRKVALIAEVKKASPSKGVIRQDFEPIDIVNDYVQAKVDAISVLTDTKFFQGSKENLIEVKKRSNVPVLRKDFILHSRQIEESKRIGADAILLIGEILEDNQIHELYEEAYELGLECLVEVHSIKTVERVLNKFTPQIIGVNNRDLNTFNTSILHTKAISEIIPQNSLLVSESGIHSNEDVIKVCQYGANAVLIGEAIMKRKDIKLAIKQLFESDNE
ncbi:indole-3-glycerol phosphate synthase TrpC [Bacillus timonensis]|nr:indole-3-glycerol phosphate synthase TrpC [Bacillus timonensis]